jgi:hypothetical protein
MPYGISKSHGGDSPANDAKMERCVRDVMKGGKSKESAIRICKSSLFGEGINEMQKEIEVIIEQAKALDAAGLEGVGKTISSTNEKKLRNAVAILMDLLEQINKSGATAGALKIDGSGIELCAGERLGTLLTRARAAKGLTTTQVAEQLPISEMMYIRIENGWNRGDLPEDILQGIAKALDLRVQDLENAEDLDILDPVEPSNSY